MAAIDCAKAMLSIYMVLPEVEFKISDAIFKVIVGDLKGRKAIQAIIEIQDSLKAKFGISESYFDQLNLYTKLYTNETEGIG